MKVTVDEEQLKRMEQAMEAQQTDNQRNEINQAQIAMDTHQAEAGIIKEQLDLGQDLQRIDYLLRGYTLEVQENGVMAWVKPKDESMEVLSEYGVHLIRNTIAWYMNKNTLLSNYYEEDIILNKMEDFAEALNDAVFMEYDKVFKYPSFEACKKEFELRLKKKADMKSYAAHLLGQEIDTEQIKQEYINEMERSLEEEFEKIRQQLMKNKLKRFELLIRVIQDAVHSTYLRSYRGEERRTLRQHIHISETKGGMNVQEKSGFLDMFKPKR